MEQMMIMMKNVFAAALLAGAAVATLTVARADQSAGTHSYASLQAISHSFGSKRAVGYFAPQNGACAVTMFLAEAEDGHIAPSAARIKFSVKPGDSAELSSVEGKGLEVKCGKDAAAVEVRQTGLTTASAATQ
jgi:hypothetical protein